MPPDEEIDYLTHFENRANYERRVQEEGDAGKTVMIGVICPECMYQIRTKSLRNQPTGKFVFCNCPRDAREIVSDDSVVAAIAPESWGIRKAVVVMMDSDVRW